jgi:hypothetical protein
MSQMKPQSVLGPLAVSKINPRYFSDATGRLVYLTGSHTWYNLQPSKLKHPKQPEEELFDYEGFLKGLQKCGHNFIRLWRWEHVKYAYGSGRSVLYCPLQPWARTGPGVAVDGEPRFDLTQLSADYFQRLRKRVVRARECGIYVGIMLFEGHALYYSQEPWRTEGHPFQEANNINYISFQGTEVHTLARGAIIEIQHAYVRRVIETVNDLPNVLYEICNEAGHYSKEWQYHMIEFVKGVEAELADQHPVGMTKMVPDVSNADLFDSPADWISPVPGLDQWDEEANRPITDRSFRQQWDVREGAKVVLWDDDHFSPGATDPELAWKAFFSGGSYLQMISGIPTGTPMQQAMGYTRMLAEQVDLAHMTPHGELCATSDGTVGCLASPGQEYLVRQTAANSHAFSVELEPGTYRARWFEPNTGMLSVAGVVQVAETGVREFRPPSGGAVLHLVAVTSDPKGQGR